jgi:hypothetical protein
MVKCKYLYFSPKCKKIKIILYKHEKNNMFMCFNVNTWAVILALYKIERPLPVNFVVGTTERIASHFTRKLKGRYRARGTIKAHLCLN